MVYSSIFLSVVFGWSVWNGATYYVDVFGKRFQKELEDLRAQVEQWQNSPRSLSDIPSGATTVRDAPVRQDKRIPPGAAWHPVRRSSGDGRLCDVRRTAARWR